jgi:1-acyl-sn-glycerol-3-phosphate acyltransferase
MVQRLQPGRAVAIFPEGGIKPGAPMRVFHARLFRAEVDAGLPVQPVMVRYMRDGRRDGDISFRIDESMLKNFARMLAGPAAIAEVHFLSSIDATGQPRRRLADAARAAVISSYESQ